MQKLYSLFLVALIGTLAIYMSSVKNMGKTLSQPSSKSATEKSVEDNKDVKVLPSAQSSEKEKKIDPLSEFPFFNNRAEYKESKEGNNTVLTTQIKPFDSARIDNYLNYTLQSKGWIMAGSDRRVNTSRVLSYQKGDQKVVVQVVFNQTANLYTLLRYSFSNSDL